jgi:hypothetical protein
VKKSSLLPKRLIILDKQQAIQQEKRQSKTNEHQEHLLSLYFPEFDPVQFEEMESDYHEFYHNKLVKNKIQSAYDNYKKEHNDEYHLTHGYIILLPVRFQIHQNIKLKHIHIKRKVKKKE